MILPTLTSTASIDHSVLTLPTRSPTLIASRRLPITPDPTRHSAAVSDAHLVCSHPVPPSRPKPLPSDNPSLLPCTLTRDDPVEPVFALRPTLIAPLSTDQAMLRLPTIPPALTDARRLPMAAALIITSTLVSDSHLVPSQADAPAFDKTLCPLSPKPKPSRVTLADPVPAAFAARPPLSTALSVDKATDKLPARCPTLDTTRMLPLAPEAVRHRADVSDIHAVCSHAVRPDRAAPLHAPSPSPRPDTVALIDPVDAALLAASTLAPPTSPETAAVRLPTLAPPLTTTRTLPLALSPPRHSADVSDIQKVADPALEPVRPDTEYRCSPILAPCTVTLTLPDPAQFELRAPLIAFRSVENKRLTLPARRPALNVISRLPSIPDLA